MGNEPYDWESDMGVVGVERPMGSESDTRSQTVRKVVIFHLADQAYAIPLAMVLEILPMALLAQPPGLPPLLAGFLNLRGAAVPVVRLTRLFGLADQAPGLYTPLLIVRCGDNSLALLVDAVKAVAQIEESASLPLRENFCFNDCAERLVIFGGTNIVLLSCQRLLREQEQRRINELTAIEQARLVSFEEQPS
jgi:purine-binding chemotaxis protein CheW